ncbi:hypothetical protein A2W24_03170 [Microgenomates group bacterium RBG_16_45_19]|nr:MAG: hypothetical protein A2W24_03170 [Microgenomates group bacterium RBG_16_45_19]
MTKAIPKVGFDLDGVILYNPARLARPLITGYKRLILNKPLTAFTIPHTPLQRFIWTLLHKSSFFIAPGFNELKTLVRQGRLEAYLVTARFDFLKSDLDRWLEKIEADKIFKAVYFNQKNEQPHLYKLKIIKQLQLDYFVEDNWDIVKNLAVAPHLNTKIFWIYNLFDRRLAYPYKYPTLRRALAALKPNL